MQNLMNELEIFNSSTGGQNILLGARPGVGKTSLGFTVARKAALDYDEPALLFSFEMSEVSVIQRLLSSESEISFENVKEGNFSSRQYRSLNESIVRLNNAPISIETMSPIGTNEIRETIVNTRLESGISLLVIDYFELIEGENDLKKREEKHEQIGKELSSLAKEKGITILSLAQLNRDVEKRQDERLRLEDIRAFYEDLVDIFDQVWLLNRDISFSGNDYGFPKANLEVITTDDRSSNNYQLDFEDEYLRFTGFGEDSKSTFGKREN